MNDSNLEQEATEVVEDALATFGLGRKCPYWLPWYRQLLITIGKYAYLLGYRLRPVLNPRLQKLSEHGLILRLRFAWFTDSVHLDFSKKPIFVRSI